MSHHIINIDENARLVYLEHPLEGTGAWQRERRIGARWVPADLGTLRQVVINYGTTLLVEATDPGWKDSLEALEEFVEQLQHV